MFGSFIVHTSRYFDDETTGRIQSCIDTRLGSDQAKYFRVAAFESAFAMELSSGLQPLSPGLQPFCSEGAKPNMSMQSTKQPEIPCRFPAQSCCC